MSMFSRKLFTCAVCGEKSEHGVVISTNAFGSSDLDLRPPEMERSTMYCWVRSCPHCGYTNDTIEEPTRISPGFLKREEYLSCDGIPFQSELAARFYRQYMITASDGDKTRAFYALLHAAWACDDCKDASGAAACRRLSLPFLDELIRGDAQNADALRLMKADIMRRAGLFAELREEFASVRFSHGRLERILEFQLERARQEDSGCYKVSDVDGPDGGEEE